jgi:hypothetical protein
MSTTRTDGWPSSAEEVGPDGAGGRAPSPRDPRPGAEDGSGAEPRLSLGALVKRWLATTEHLESRRRANGDAPVAPWSPPADVAAASGLRARPPLDPALVAPESVSVHPEPDEAEAHGGDGGADARAALPRRRRGTTVGAGRHRA